MIGNSKLLSFGRMTVDFPSSTILYFFYSECNSHRGRCQQGGLVYNQDFPKASAKYNVLCDCKVIYYQTS